MKYIIASDIHGSFVSAEKIVEVFKKEKADKIILLGDIYYHGPRNVIPEWYDPKKVAEIFNRIKDNLIVIKGNCDAEVDQMISEFDFIPHGVIESGEKLVFLTHGHIYNKDNLPKSKFDAIIYGHFHTGFIEREKNVVFANPGSTTLPKNSTPKSYIILENGVLSLFDFDDKAIISLKI